MHKAVINGRDYKLLPGTDIEDVARNLSDAIRESPQLFDLPVIGAAVHILITPATTVVFEDTETLSAESVPPMEGNSALTPIAGDDDLYW